MNTSEFLHSLDGKRVKEDDDSANKELLLFCNHALNFEDFSILATYNNDIKVTLMESLLISRDHLPLNENKQSLPSELFDSQGTKFCHMISREIDSFCCSSFILRVVLLSHEFYIQQILILQHDFVRFHLIAILKQNINFSFNIYSLTMTVVSVETLGELK